MSRWEPQCPAQQPTLEDADEVVEEVALPAVDIPLVRFGLDQAVSLADELAEKVEIVRIGTREEIAEPGAGKIGCMLQPVHSRHGIVALGQGQCA